MIENAEPVESRPLGAAFAVPRCTCLQGSPARKIACRSMAVADRIADQMLTCPSVHGPAVTVGQLRAFFGDAHVHAALLVDEGTLVGVVERTHITPDLGDDTPARAVAVLDGSTVRLDAAADRALEAMKRKGRRRLAVVGEDGELLGLLCLKASGLGFCTDNDVSSRRTDQE